MGRMRTEAKSPRKQMVREGSIWKVPGKGPPASLCLLLSQFGRRPLGGKWLFSHQWAGTLTGPLRMESSAERVFGGTTPNFKQRKGHHAEKSVAQGGRTRKRVSSYRVRHWQSERRGVGASTTPGSEKYSSACSIQGGNQDITDPCSRSVLPIKAVFPDHDFREGRDPQFYFPHCPQYLKQHRQ